MDLCVAVINYNTRGELRRCLVSLLDRAAAGDYRVLVVDNASTDGSATMVRAEFGTRVELLANRENLGFARAVNQALERSDGRYLLVLNADTEPRPGAIRTLYEFMERTPQAAVAGAQLVGVDGTLQHSCRRFYDLPAILLRRTPLGRLLPQHPALRRHLMLDWDHAEARRVDWLQGACLALRREVMEQVGGLDERFFLYFEDVDLCRRVAQAGHGVYYVPDAVVVHHYRRGSHAGMLSREKLHHLASGVRYLAKWNARARRVLGLLRALGLLLLLVCDLALIGAAFLLSLRLGGALAVDPQPVPLSSYYPILAGAALLVPASFASAGLYRVERSRDWLASCVRAGKAVTWVALLGMVALFFAPGYERGFIHSRLTLLVYYALLIGGACGSRLLLRLALRFLWRRRLLLRPILITGDLAESCALAEAIRDEPLSGYQVVGVHRRTYDDPTAESREARPGAELARRLDELRPQGLVVVARTLPVRDHVPQILAGIERGLEVRVVTDPGVVPYLRRLEGEICGWPAADVTRTPLYPLKRAVKRLTDLLLATAALAALAPLLALLCAAIWLHDRGPALFIQRRVGKHGRSFRMVKLRTMRVGTELDQVTNVAEGPLTLIPDDPRVTRLGRWLRRHKVDELPQLWNVIAGHMSLVGPRPPTPNEVAEYTEWQRGRLAMRPGLTGLWQIDKQRKWRFNEMVELDLQYILNWSIVLDYGIIVRTIPAVLRGS